MVKNDLIPGTVTIPDPTMAIRGGDATRSVTTIRFSFWSLADPRGSSLAAHYAVMDGCVVEPA